MQSLQPLSPPAGQDTLIPCFTGQIGATLGPVCKARDVHGFLQVGRDFPTWFQDRVEKYGFVENQDFALMPRNGEIKNGRGGDRRSKDYLTSLDMAKELAMVANNDQGAAARRYFIAMEKQALKLMGQTPIGEPAAPPAETYVVEMDQRGYIRYLEGMAGIQARRVEAPAPVADVTPVRRLVPPEEKAEIIRLYNAGWSKYAIGKHLGRNHKTINRILEKATATGDDQGDLFTIPEVLA